MTCFFLKLAPDEFVVFFNRFFQTEQITRFTKELFSHGERAKEQDTSSQPLLSFFALRKMDKAQHKTLQTQYGTISSPKTIPTMLHFFLKALRIQLAISYFEGIWGKSYSSKHVQ